MLSASTSDLREIKLHVKSDPRSSRLACSCAAVNSKEFLVLVRISNNRIRIWWQWQLVNGQALEDQPASFPSLPWSQAAWPRGRTPALWSFGTVFESPRGRRNIFFLANSRWSYWQYWKPWPRWGLGLVSSLLYRSGYQGSLKGHCNHSLLSTTRAW